MGVAAGASAAAAGLGLASGIMSGQGTQAADQYQAGLLSERAQAGQAASIEASSNSVQRLNVSLANLDAVRAAGGDSPASPTGLALRSTTEDNMNLTRAIRVGNILSQSEMDTAGSNYLTQAGQFGLMQGILGGAAGAANDIFQTKPSTFGFSTA